MAGSLVGKMYIILNMEGHVFHSTGHLSNYVYVTNGNITFAYLDIYIYIYIAYH